jgi:hypothetical protein
VLWKESWNSDDLQFHQYQQNKPPPLTLTHWTQNKPPPLTLTHWTQNKPPPLTLTHWTQNKPPPLTLTHWTQKHHYIWFWKSRSWFWTGTKMWQGETYCEHLFYFIALLTMILSSASYFYIWSLITLPKF